MSIAKQYLILLRMSLGASATRWGLVFTVMIGVFCAVGVLVSMLAMGEGARREALGNVRADRAILMSVGAQQPPQSSIPKDAAALISELPGIRRNVRGEPIAVFEAGFFVTARTKTDGSLIGFPVNGVTPGLTEYMPELHLTAGRMFRTGVRELIASNKCTQQFSDFAVGDERSIRGAEWRVVGNFNLGDAEGVCTVFADADTILSSFGSTNYNQADVMLQSPAAFAVLSRALKENPTLKYDVRPEAQVIEQNNRQLNGILNFVSYFVGAIMAAAATIGAANSLYAIVDARRREFATLRALGFSGLPIVASILSESMLLALPGALLGALAAWLLFNGLQASPLGSSFHLAVTLSLALLGLGWALTIGLISGLLPAVRAARVPVAVAMRAM